MSTEHTSIQFELSKELKEKIQDVFFDHKYLSVYIRNGPRTTTSKPVRSKVHVSSMRATLEQFDKKIDGVIDTNTKLLCIYSIKYNLRKYVKFDDGEQKWYSENFPNDPSNLRNDENGVGVGSKAELALEVIKNHYDKLFVDEYQNPHIAISVSGHLETLPLKSKRFRNWMANSFYKTTGLVIKSQDLKDAINILNAQAEFDNGDPIRLNLRVAENEGTKKWYYDLTNKNWEFVEITSEGWKIVNNVILFHRYSNQLPQVYPSKEYTSDIFDKFIKLVLSASVKKDKLEEYKILLICYIICAFVPNIPKAVPMPFGHQGAAKTSIMEFIKMLIDPSAIKTLSFPSDNNELIQQLSHNYLAFYDNISTLRDRTSDQLCRAVTGSGSSTRILYSDDDDFIRSFKRCIGLNGINLAATKPDLLDRALFFELKRIENKDRRKIEDISKEFEAMRPQLLGYILDVLVKVLRWKSDHGKLNLELPRMADWAEWCEIISRCVGNEDGAFLRAFQNNRKIQIEQIIESSQVATCLIYHIENHPDKFDDPNWGFEGTASELLEILQSIAPAIGIDTRNNWWPKAPNALSRRLNEIAHTLREAGIELEFVKSPDRNRVRTIRIRKISSISSISSVEEIQDSVTAENDAKDSGRNEFGRLDGSDGDLHTNKEISVTENAKAISPPGTQEKNSKGPEPEEHGSDSFNPSEADNKKAAISLNEPQFITVEDGGKINSQRNSILSEKNNTIQRESEYFRNVTASGDQELSNNDNSEEKKYVLMLMLKEIEAAKGSIVSVPDALRTVHDRNSAVRNYIGDKLTQRENQKIRELFRDINRHKGIEPVKHKPQLLVKWKLSQKDDSTKGAP